MSIVFRTKRIVTFLLTTCFKCAYRIKNCKPSFKIRSLYNKMCILLLTIIVSFPEKFLTTHYLMVKTLGNLCLVIKLRSPKLQPNGWFARPFRSQLCPHKNKKKYFVLHLRPTNNSLKRKLSSPLENVPAYA